jgi:hypothetical protein
MPALTSSNVRLVKSWTEGTVTGKRRKVRVVEVYGGIWGGSANTMPASAFGLRVIEEATTAVYAGHAFISAPDPTGTPVYIFSFIGGSGTPADVDIGTTPDGMYLTVKGY